MVILPGEVPVGEMVPARITGAMEYDLIGEVDEGRGEVTSPLPEELSVLVQGAE
jgi:hypothetical protein